MPNRAHLKYLLLILMLVMGRSLFTLPVHAQEATAEATATQEVTAEATLESTTEATAEVTVAPAVVAPTVVLTATPEFAESVSNQQVAAPGLANGVLLVGLGVVGFMGAYVWWRKYQGKGDLD